MFKQIFELFQSDSLYEQALLECHDMLDIDKKMFNESIKTLRKTDTADISIDIDCKIGTIKHQYSHFKINLIGYKCNYKKGTPKPLESEEIKWIKNNNIDNFAFPKSTSKFLTLAGYKK